MGKDADLLEAARSGTLQVVDKILSARSRRSGPLASLRRGPGANVQDSSGYTALHHASLNGHKDVVALLLSHEASCNVQDGKGSTPLHLAAWAGHTEVVRTLLHKGISISNVNHQNKGGETALHCASQYGHTEAAQLLLARGGDPTVPNLQAETALDLAAQYGRLSTVEVLVRAHPDLLRPYTVAAASAAVFPHTPLHRASRNGHREVVKLLLTRGHHVNVRTGQGAPLHEAALCGKVDVVRVLLEAGADPEVRDDRGNTVLDTIALINTPITQEITNLIKYHGHLINLDDDDDDEDPGDPPPWSPPVWPPPSWSPLAVPAMPEPSELGSPYENVLIPTIVHPEMSVEDGEGGRENRASSRASDRESRASDRESRASDRESRTSDRESRTSDRESRMSDRDGRTSVASRMSEATSDWSIYDVPPPPKTVSGGSDRGSLSYRSQTSEGGDDDGVYEVPPPPRSCRSSSTSLRTSRDSRHLRPSSDELPQPATSPGSTSSSSAPVTRRGGGTATTDTTCGSKVVEPLPPPKPPRRSMCPPSPTPDSAEQDQGTYEAIFFKGQDQSDYENVENVQQKQQLQPPPPTVHSRTRSSSATFTHSHAHTHDSSDSDYDTPRPMQPAHAHSNRMYSTISFKPVKSRRTSKMKDAGHVYENTIHRYENLTAGGRYHTLREKDHHHHRDHREQDLRDREHRGGGGGGGGSGGGGSGGGGEQRDTKDSGDGRHQHQQPPPPTSSHHPHHHHHHLLHHNENLHNQDNARDHHQHPHHHRNETSNALLRDRNENLRDRIALTLPRRPRAATAFSRSTVGRADSSEDSDGEHRPRSLELREARAKVSHTCMHARTQSFHYFSASSLSSSSPLPSSASSSGACKAYSLLL